jgi:pyruvate formate lyase activating enzyme
MNGRLMSVDEIMAEIERDVIFYDQSQGGVTFSGGEPLLQPGFLIGLLQACKQRGIHTAVDTCGYAAWEVFDQIRPLTDLFLYDLKLMDTARHHQHTGVPNGPILRNLVELSRLGHPVIVRIPIIPGVNDDEDNLAQAERFLKNIPTLQRVDLLPYHRIGEGKYAALQREYKISAIEPPQPEQMRAAAEVLAARRLPVKIGA